MIQVTETTVYGLPAWEVACGWSRVTLVTPNGYGEWRVIANDVARVGTTPGAAVDAALLGYYTGSGVPTSLARCLAFAGVLGAQHAAAAAAAAAATTAAVTA